MATFNLDDLNPGTWFDLEGSGRVCVRVCAHEDLKRIQKATTKRRFEYKRGQRFEITETDEDRYDELLWDFCIVDWQGLKDKSGNPIPCTTEMKLKLMRRSVRFASFLADCLERLTTIEAAHEEEVEKN